MSDSIMKDIEGYEGLYAVTAYGGVYSYRKEGWLELPINNSGYATVTLYGKGQRMPIGVHRLVAKMFIPNPDNLPQVNHIDGNKLNNSVGNLEWSTLSYNQLHSVRAGLKKSKSGRVKMPCGDILIFKNQNDVCRFFGLYSGAFSRLLNGKQTSHLGWTRCT